MNTGVTMSAANTNGFVNCSREHRSNTSTNRARDLRCHLCCRNFSSEGYYEYHVKKYHRGGAREQQHFASNQQDNPAVFVPENSGTERSSNIWEGFMDTAPDDLRCRGFKYSSVRRLFAVKERAEREQRICSARENCIRREAASTLNNAIVNRCTKIGKPWSNSVDHIKAIHEFKLDVREFNCGFCKKSCLNPLHFELHQWGRKDVHKPFVCPTCFQNFRKKSHLKKHKIRHLVN